MIFIQTTNIIYAVNDMSRISRFRGRHPVRKNKTTVIRGTLNEKSKICPFSNIMGSISYTRCSNDLSLPTIKGSNKCFVNANGGNYFSKVTLFKCGLVAKNEL